MAYNPHDILAYLSHFKLGTLGTFVISGLIIGSFVALMAFGIANKSPATSQSGITRMGKPAPEFTLPLFSGDLLEFSREAGQPVVINFWASWCPPCREEAPLLEQAWKTYKDTGLLFIGVDIQDSKVAAISYLEEFNITYPNGLDADGTITVDYGVIGLPVTFFVNKQGIVQRRWVGGIQESQLTPWIEELVIN